MGLRPSDNKQGLSWIASLGFAALGIAASLLAYAVLSSTTHSRFWVVARGETFGLPAQIVSIAYFCWAALSEEIAKALGALSARLTSSRLSWWTIAAFVGATFGLIERVLLMISWTPEFLAQVPPAVGTALNISAVFSHAALCVLSVGIALALRGSWRSWILGVIAAGALHAAYNLLPRFIDLGWAYARPTISVVIMLTILIVTFVLRDRIAHRAA
jgi:RsiW-degrading membrane proteinase PrsW (M82 family)